MKFKIINLLLFLVLLNVTLSKAIADEEMSQSAIETIRELKNQLESVQQEQDRYKKNYYILTLRSSHNRQKIDEILQMNAKKIQNLQREIEKTHFYDTSKLVQLKGFEEEAFLNRFTTFIYNYDIGCKDYIEEVQEQCSQYLEARKEWLGLFPQLLDVLYGSNPKTKYQFWHKLEKTIENLTSSSQINLSSCKDVNELFVELDNKMKSMIIYGRKKS